MKRKTVVITVVILSCVIFFGFMGAMILVGIMGDVDNEFYSGFSGFGPNVAVVEIYGAVYDSRSFVRQIVRWTDDNSVKAIVLDINSPGGASVSFQEMYDAVLKARESGKIVVASLGTVAASGGYYVACAADRIVANPSTLTGSIGVIMSFPTAKKLLDKIGLKWETVKSGDLKDVGAMDRGMTPEEERMLQAVIDDTYEQFVEAVAEGRNRDKEEIYPLADGSIFTGRQAYNMGLVDTLGTYYDALDIAGELSGIGPKPDIVRERKRKPGLFDVLNQSLNLLERISGIENNQPGLLYQYK
ncbi:MAG: signal peptide peptidase SppA [candidate division Zixibacteria bacterium]